MKSLSVLSLVLALALTACDAGLATSETVAAPSGSSPACTDGMCPTSAMKSAPAAAAADCGECPSSGKCEESPDCPQDPAECKTGPCEEKAPDCGTEKCPKAGN